MPGIPRWTVSLSSRSSTSRSLTAPQYLEALQREARLAAGLDHPNITTVYDFQVEGDIAYVVMESVPDWVDDKGRPSGYPYNAHPHHGF